jgi:hypothetical protein
MLALQNSGLRSSNPMLRSPSPTIWLGAYERSPFAVKSSMASVQENAYSASCTAQ